MKRSEADSYVSAILGEAVRVLGLMDREAMSRTYGCLDRTYWAWKFTDFPGARFQEGLCTLAYLYCTPLEGSPYHGDPRLRQWIAAGFDFWARIQRPSGDFDEAYPFERSLAATAFTSFYLCEAWELLGGDLPEPTASRFKHAVGLAGDWLIRNDETHGFLSNHLAAAATALYHAYRITGEKRFEARSRHFLTKILDHQSQEGWYDEYGGADPGYQTHGSFYLARYLELSGDEALGASLERSFEFLAHFVHPDRSLGGEYASRNTQTYYPAAFEMMAPYSGRASWIAARMLPTVRSLAAAGLGSVDRYNYFPLLNNYVFAHRAASLAANEAASPIEPEIENGLVHFPQAGLAKIRRSRYDLYIGLKKGGVLKLFDRARERHIGSDCGYIGRLKSGRVFSSQWISAESEVELSDREVRIAARFYEISRPVMNPLTFLGFRIFSLTLGRYGRFAAWLKVVLVKALIYRRKELDLGLVRLIRLRDDGIEIRDRLEGGLGPQIETLSQEEIFTTIHMGSSRYFVPAELAAPAKAPESGWNVDVSALESGVERIRRLELMAESA
jgi:hypothetical protein